MKERRLGGRAALFLFVYGAALISGCNLGTAGPSAWIDQPLDGSAFPIQPILIQAHASNADGVREIEFLANGAQVAVVEVGGGRLEEATVQWTPASPGKYTIEARAASSNGVMGPSSSVVIFIGEAGTEPPGEPVIPSETTDASPSPTSQELTETSLPPTSTFLPPTSPPPTATLLPPTSPPPTAVIPPPDTTPPQIVSAFVLPNSILTEGSGCPDYARAISVQAVVTDNVGVYRVSASWDISGTEFGEIELSAQGGDSYQGAIGPVHSVGTMVIYVSVLDAEFNPASTDAFFVDVQNCIE